MRKDAQLLSALCYPLWPVALVLLILDKSDKTVRYHAFNAIGLWLAFGALAIAVTIISAIPIAGPLLHVTFWVAVVIVVILYAIDAYKGKKIVIPVVTPFLRKNIKEFK